MLTNLELLKKALGKKAFRYYKKDVKLAMKEYNPQGLARYAYALAEVLDIDYRVMLNGTLELVEKLNK